MMAMIKRNLLLYFRNRSGVFFSLLGALISFVLYLVFLKKSMLASWLQVPDAKVLLDNWLIGGTLAITGITTTLTNLSQLVIDQEKQVTADLELTDAGPLRLFTSYLVSATIIGISMQIVMLGIMWGGFYLTDGLTLTLGSFVNVVGLIVMSSILATAVNAVIIRGIHSEDSLGKLGTIVGTASGFLVGTYIPVGTMPSLAQNLVKFIPGSYVAALYRQFLMDGKLTTAFSGQTTARRHFEKLMGIRLNWSTLLTQRATYQIMGLIFVIAVVLAFMPKWWQVRRQRRQIHER
ncbi:ABC transporter, integral membrane protein [Levilactobacillus senmaizukei DSM 21775 = NBRC 103853]|uniref:ABC transporter, integral membrane protein n=1 Tax=Levilactobacillus senmaizukei DSM 21775 = NBRC 103853 TaxID=1423803 RepID=A0A0R2DQM4_9LACO|nr:ABC transporter permease [Levilactobacillus senmaizukei]KRN02196.1 ABC transporter, integral membrane protein [Levilactobacillus senmaizukei DSM 21775 = NBRC 103853]